MSKRRKDVDAAVVSDGKLLFLDHVTRVGQYVREKKKIIPIIWDDMLRNIPLGVLQVLLKPRTSCCCDYLSNDRSSNDFLSTMNGLTKRRYPSVEKLRQVGYYNNIIQWTKSFRHLDS
jgi:hypothetical protein